MSLFTIDTRGLLIPLMLMKVSHAYRSIEPGDVLKVLMSDAEVPDALFKILPDATYDIHPKQGFAGSEPCFFVNFEKTSKGVPHD